MNRRIAVTLSFALLFAAGVRAHVVITPREATAGAEQTYTMRVPTEGTVSTTSVELEIPAGLQVIEVQSGDGFTVDVRKEKDRIVAITWTREIKPKEFALFTFTARNPEPGTLQWRAHQTFADGSARHWIGERGSKEPASVTTIVPKGVTAPPGEHDHKP